MSTRPEYIPPADYVEIASDHPLVARAWRTPGGWRHVEMVDDTEETWERYCAAKVEEKRRQLRAAQAKKRRAFPYCVFPVSALEFGGFAGVESPVRDDFTKQGNVLP